MKVRVITAAVLLIVLVPVVILGDLFLDIALALLSMGATYELFKMYKADKFEFNAVLVIEVILSAGVFFSTAFYLKGNLELEYLFVLILFIMVITGIVLVFEDDFTSEDFGRLLVSVLYPSIGFAVISWLRDIDLYNIGFLFMITIFTDVFAYIFGINFGKHRLAVKISPKKSIEGSIGGTVSALLLTLLYIYLLDINEVGEINLNIWISILLIVFISIVGQIGDLIASKLKRGNNIKDFSQLFPGHGGVMDRFDSVIFAGITLVLISKVVGLL
jgi:phosphatidate cytidylyltransferase